MTGMRAVQTGCWSRGLTLPLRLTLSRPGRREREGRGGGDFVRGDFEPDQLCKYLTKQHDTSELFRKFI